MQLEEWEERLPGEAGCGKSAGGRERAWAKARRDDLESVRKTEDSVHRGYPEHACGWGPQSPEAFFFSSGVRVGSKFINMATWPCARCVRTLVGLT